MMAELNSDLGYPLPDSDSEDDAPQRAHAAERSVALDTALTRLLLEREQRGIKHLLRVYGPLVGHEPTESDRDGADAG